MGVTEVSKEALQVYFEINYRLWQQRCSWENKQKSIGFISFRQGITLKPLASAARFRDLWFYCHLIVLYNVHHLFKEN